MLKTLYIDCCLMSRELHRRQPMTDHAPILSTLLTHGWWVEINQCVISCGLPTILIPLNTLYLKLIWDLYMLH